MIDAKGIYVVTVSNVSGKAQRIVSLKGGSGDITHTLKAEELAPGAKTELTLEFTFGDLVGPVERKLGLMTQAEGASEPVRNEIVLKGEIPTPLQFSTKALIWIEGEPPTAKELTIAVAAGSKVEQVLVEAPDANLLVQVTTAKGPGGRGLVVTAKPSTTDLTVIDPQQRASQHLRYSVSYSLPGGVQRKETFTVLLAKRPGP